MGLTGETNDMRQALVLATEGSWLNDNGLLVDASAQIALNNASDSDRTQMTVRRFWIDVNQNDNTWHFNMHTDINDTPDVLAVSSDGQWSSAHGTYLLMGFEIALQNQSTSDSGFVRLRKFEIDVQDDAQTWMLDIHLDTNEEADILSASSNGHWSDNTGAHLAMDVEIALYNQSCSSDHAFQAIRGFLFDVNQDTGTWSTQGHVDSQDQNDVLAWFSTGAWTDNEAGHSLSTENTWGLMTTNNTARRNSACSSRAEEPRGGPDDRMYVSWRNVAYEVSTLPSKSWLLQMTMDTQDQVDFMNMTMGGSWEERDGMFFTMTGSMSVEPTAGGDRTLLGFRDTTVDILNTHPHGYWSIQAAMDLTDSGFQLTQDMFVVNTIASWITTPVDGEDVMISFDMPQCRFDIDRRAANPDDRQWLMMRDFVYDRQNDVGIWNLMFAVEIKDEADLVNVASHGSWEEVGQIYSDCFVLTLALKNDTNDGIEFTLNGATRRDDGVAKTWGEQYELVVPVKDPDGSFEPPSMCGQVGCTDMSEHQYQHISSGSGTQYLTCFCGSSCEQQGNCCGDYYPICKLRPTPKQAARFVVAPRLITLKAGIRVHIGIPL